MFTDRFIEENAKNEFWSLNKKIGALFVAVVLTAILFNTTGCTQNGSEQVEVQQQEELPKENVKVGDDGISGAIAPDDIASPVDMLADQEPKKNDSSMVAMSLEETGRQDPFLPVNEIVVSNRTAAKANIDLVPPPETITADPTATEVITTKVSGLMYDRHNPSAIINIAGVDYLVRKGDIVNNYNVLSIDKESVTVQYGANIYKAGVGQIFTGDGINFNTISNLDSKFGGRRKK